MSPRLPTLLALLLAASPAAATGWQQDFAALKTALARDYANFGHAVAVQRLDLASLVARAETELQTAPDLKARQSAIIRLVDAFQDPHLAAYPTDPPGPAPAPQPACTTPPAAPPSGPPLPGAEALEGRLRTPGAGCGQRTGGGNEALLPALGLTLTMPDCIRLRADGSNERAGIAPDIPVEPGPEQETRLLAALDSQLPPRPPATR